MAKPERVEALVEHELVPFAHSREAALRAITLDAAYSWRMEDSLRSLEEGEVAP